MKTIVVRVSTGYVGSDREDEFQVEDDATEEEIHKIALEVREELCDWSWNEKDSEDEE